MNMKILKDSAYFYDPRWLVKQFKFLNMRNKIVLMKLEILA